LTLEWKKSKKDKEKAIREKEMIILISIAILLFIGLFIALGKI